MLLPSFARMAFSFLFFLLSLTRLSLATEGDATLIAKFKDWSVYKGAKDVVFIASRPIKQSGTYAKREDPYLIVSYFEKDVIEVSVFTGYTYKAGSQVVAKIASAKDASKLDTFTLSPQAERAWLKGEQDKALIEKMKNGSKVVIDGESFRGTTSKDEYSLAGFTEAYNKMLSSK